MSLKPQREHREPPEVTPLPGGSQAPDRSEMSYRHHRSVLPTLQARAAPRLSCLYFQCNC